MCCIFYICNKKYNTITGTQCNLLFILDAGDLKLCEALL